VLLVVDPTDQPQMLAGQERRRTIPLADIHPRPGCSADPFCAYFEEVARQNGNTWKRPLCQCGAYVSCVIHSIQKKRMDVIMLTK
jgi:hypothetical protein